MIAESYLYIVNNSKNSKKGECVMKQIDKNLVYYIFLKIKSSIINKSTSADKCRVSNKAIQKDISDLCSYFSEFYSSNE